MDCMVHGVTKSCTWLNNFHFTSSVPLGYEAMETGSGPYRKTQMSFLISQLHRAYSYIFTPQLPIVWAIGLITLEQPNCQCRRINDQGSWISSVQSLSRVQLFSIPWTAASQVSLSIANSWSLLKLMSIGWVMPPNHLILCRPLSSRLQSFPSGSFPMSQFFTSGGQSIGVSASASVLPKNTQDWSPLEWTGWISLQSRDSQESSPTPQFKSINSSVSVSICYLGWS